MIMRCYQSQPVAHDRITGRPPLEVDIEINLQVCTLAFSV
jgi:hypothetical protein